MGKNNRARRAAKAKQRARVRAPQAHEGRRRGPDSWRDADHPSTSRAAFDDAEVAEVMWAAAGQTSLGRRISDPTTALDRLGTMSRSTVTRAAERVFSQQIALLWDNGWQPAELYRHARLGGRSGVVARLVELAVSVDCSGRLGEGLDPRWREQAEGIRLPARESVAGWLARWLARWETAESADGSVAYPIVADALHVLFDLPRIEELVPPPGRPAPARQARSTTADPVLQRVRNLLAKAESTQFEAEATALTAKAQEMITRHAIDVALLEESEDPGHAHPRPTLIRLPIDAPYADAKSLLLQTVAGATRCRAVFVPRLSLSNVVGLPTDLGAVEVLFTSLLVQAQHALGEAARTAGPGTRSRSQSFRSAFLLAYTQRIGERLDEINEHVFGAAEEDSARFLPVLRSHQDAVDQFMAERFGETVASGVRGGFDSAGWARGRMAADAARLSSGDLEAAGTPHLF